MVAAWRCAATRAARWPLVSLALAMTVVALASWTGSVDTLALERGATARLELWRVLSCHFVHWSWAHASWDLLAFVVLAAICESVDRRRFLLCLGSAAVAIAAVVTAARPQLAAYAGLSGLDMALFGLTVGQLFRARFAGSGWAGRTVLVLAAIGLVGKLAYELASGASLIFAEASAGFVPVPEAHLVGALVGLGWSFSFPHFPC